MSTKKLEKKAEQMLIDALIELAYKHGLFAYASGRLSAYVIVIKGQARDGYVVDMWNDEVITDRKQHLYEIKKFLTDQRDRFFELLPIERADYPIEIRVDLTTDYKRVLCLEIKELVEVIETNIVDYQRWEDLDKASERFTQFLTSKEQAETMWDFDFSIVGAK